MLSQTCVEPTMMFRLYRSQWKSEGTQGLANRLRHEPCAVIREDASEASAVLHVGEVIVHRKSYYLECRGFAIS